MNLSGTDFPWLEHRTIILAETGSKAYGTDTEESDTDYKGVCIPPVDYYLGLEAFNEYNNHSGKNFRNTKDDVDITVLHINKFVRDCMLGVPNNLELLFIEPYKYLKLTELGRILVDNRHLFLSKRIKNKFDGFAYSQIQKLKAKNRNKTGRQDLIQKYGYDSKFAYNALRLLTSAVEILTTCDFHTYRPNREYLKSIRNGFFSYEDLLKEIEYYDQEVHKAIETTKLPDAPDYQKINEMLISINRKGLQL